VPVVKNLTTARVQWSIPLTDMTEVLNPDGTVKRHAVGYFDYWVDKLPFPAAEVTRLVDATGNAVWQAKLPTTLAKGRHVVEVRSCKVGAKDPTIECSRWMSAPFDVDASGNVVPPVPPTAPGGITFITVTVAVTTSKQP
jgi:hypothetical protein